MILLYAAACAVSFAAGSLFAGLTTAVLCHHHGYQRGYAAATGDRTSRQLVRTRLATIAAPVAPRPLSHAMRDHQARLAIHLVQLGKEHRR